MPLYQIKTQFSHLTISIIIIIHLTTYYSLCQNNISKLGKLNRMQFERFNNEIINSNKITNTEILVSNKSNDCQSQLDRLQNGFRRMHRITFDFELDNIVEFAIQLSRRLPLHLNKLNRILIECKTLLSAIKENKKQLNDMQQYDDSLNNARNKPLNEQKVLFSSNNNDTLNNLIKYFDSQNKAYYNDHAQNLNRYIYTNALNRLIELLRTSKHEFLNQIDSLIKTSLKKLVKGFPLINSFIRAIEIEMQISITLNNLNFIQLKQFINKLVKRFNEDLLQIMSRLLLFNQNELEFNYRDSKFTLLLIQKSLDFIEQILEFNEKDLNNTQYSFQNYTFNYTEIRLQYLCFNVINDDITETFELCKWSNDIIDKYLSISDTYLKRIVAESFRYYDSIL